MAKYTFPGPDETVQKFEYQTSSGIMLRVYTANTYKPDLPLLYYIHGGGFVLGSVDQDDRFCDRFCELGCIVVSVEYRLAPEHKVSPLRRYQRLRR
jgi:acetyl esterase/lipase